MKMLNISILISYYYAGMEYSLPQLDHVCIFIVGKPFIHISKSKKKHPSMQPIRCYLCRNVTISTILVWNVFDGI